jgi:hypothetical protein
VTVLDDALAPLALNVDASWEPSCRVLRTILFKGKDDPTLTERLRYTRYWFGYVPIAASLLNIVELQSARKLLKFLVYLSVILVAFSAVGAPVELRIFAYSIAGVAAVFWALPYYGQSLGHAPGDAFVMLGVATFLFYRNRIISWEVLIPFSAAYGSVVTYLEFFTGQLPTASGFLFVAVYLTGARNWADSGRLICAWRHAIASLLAFIVGAGLTVALKQVLALMLTDAPALSLFTDSLIGYRSGTSDKNWLLGRLSGVLALLTESSTLTFGSTTEAIALWIAVSAAWCGAFFLARHRKDRQRSLSDLLAHGTGAMAVPAWAVLFPTHTVFHAWCMSRMLIVPIALGVSAFSLEAFRLVARFQLDRSPR